MGVGMHNDMETGWTQPWEIDGASHGGAAIVAIDDEEDEDLNFDDYDEDEDLDDDLDDFDDDYDDEDDMDDDYNDDDDL